MALVVFDRVQETTATTGTGTLTLAGAVVGFQSFAVIGDGNTTYYCIVNGDNWEVGIGTYSTTGPTLARTTVLSNYLGTTAAINLVGSSNVFVTYPSEKSVNLNAAGNVTPLGTISSGTWQGSTVGVAYGGTGVTASSGPNSVVLRDANGNVTGVNNAVVGLTFTTASGGTTNLIASSTQVQTLIGSANQTFRLPDATTLLPGIFYTFSNASSGVLTVEDNAGVVIETIAQGGAAQNLCLSTSTSAGSWGYRVFAASNVTWGNANLDYNGTITSATWQGDTVDPAYGGTGLTTFTGANNALYSTGASTLTAGTLPVAAGGTGLSATPTNGQIDIGNGTGFTRATLSNGTGISVTNGAGSITIDNSGVTSIAGTTNEIDVSASTGAVTISLPATINADTTGVAANVTGVVAVANGGTGASTASANTVFAGPSTGSPAAPSFRALVAADIPSTYSQFASGTVLLFYQAAAPTGWTQVTTQNNKALRVVSGTGGGTGGSVAFTTAFASQTPSGSVSTSISAISGTVSTSISAVAGTVGISGGSVGATTLAATQIPAHTHSFSGNTGLQSADHAHNWGNNTGGTSTNHVHGWSNSSPVAANQAFLLGSGGQVTFGDTSSVSTTGGQNVDHTHFVSGGTSGVTANHSHGFSGTTDNGTGGGQSHTHGFTNPTGSFTFSSGTASSSFSFTSGTASSSFTGSAINLAVQYIDIIICSKD
jgi:hypothetical protein